MNCSAAMRNVAAVVVFGIGMTDALIAQDVPYAHEQRLTVKGFTGTEISNHRLLVRLSESIPGFRYSQSLSHGADFRFSLEDGTVLPSECDVWNTSGESAFWVLVPTLTNGLTVCMQYGRAGDTATSGSAVWGDDYAGVWHMNVADGAVAESTHGYHGLVSNPGQVQSGVGAVGGCYLNPSKTTGLTPCVYVGNTNGSYTAFDALSGDVSFSAWVRYDGQSGAGRYGRWWNTFGGGDLYNGIYGLCYALEGSATSVTLSDRGNRAIGVTCPSLAGAWHQIVVSYSGGHRTVYIDGAEISAFDNCDTAAYVPPPWRTEWLFGARKIADSGNDEQWVGGLDEFRAQKFAATAARVAAEYEMVKGGLDYLSYERVLTDGERAGYAHCHALIVNGYADEPISDYRLLVRISSFVVPGFDPADSLSNGGDFVFCDGGRNSAAART